MKRDKLHNASNAIDQKFDFKNRFDKSVEVIESQIKCN